MATWTLYFDVSASFFSFLFVNFDPHIVCVVSGYSVLLKLFPVTCFCTHGKVGQEDIAAVGDTIRMLVLLFGRSYQRLDITPKVRNNRLSLLKPGQNCQVS